MAQITISDVSQKPATQTLAFAVEGEEFVLDVTAAESKMFFKVVQQFIDAGRTKNGTTAAAGASAPPTKSRAKKASAKKASTRKTAAKKSVGRPASAKKTAAKKTTAKKTTAKKSAATSATTNAVPAKKATAKRGPGRPSGVKLPDGTRVPRGEVEAWANSQGKTFAKRGPLSPTLLAEYAAANGGATNA